MTELVDERQDPGRTDKFFQKPAFNAYERLLCSHLIEAVTADPLKAVIHVTRAALSISKEQCENLDIDQDQAKSLFTVAQRFSMTPPTAEDGETVYSIHTGTLDWEIDLLPWVRCDSYQTILTDEETYDWDELREKDDTVKLFHYSAARLSTEGYRHLVADFLFYAMHAAEDMTRKIAETINAETYTQLLRMYHGERP